MRDLNTMKVAEIKAIAKELNIKGWWDMKKADLIEAIEALGPLEDYILDEQLTEELAIDDTKEEVEEVEEVVSESAQEAPEEVNEEDNVIVNEVEETTSEDAEENPRKNKKRLIEYKGETKTLTAWAKELGIRHQTLYNRIIMKGMDPAEAFEMPLKKGKKEVETK